MHVLLVLTSALLCAAGPPAKSSCSAKELRRRDCRLASGAYNLRLSEKTVAWSDGVWRTVDELPMTGDGVEWEKARFDFLGGRPVLQLWIWDKGAGEAQVQSLHWYVADAEKRKLTVLAEGVVRKRRRKDPLAPEAVGEAPSKPARAPKYIHDSMENHSLKPLKGGALEWTLGKQKKILEKVTNGL